MDGTTTTLKEKLDQLLREAAEVSVALDRVEGTIVGVPHYSVIEARAHELGQKLSRRIQTRQMGELAAGAPPSAKCPECGTRCDTSRKKRQVTSIDGTLTVDEPIAHCPKCRRGFFPPQGGAGP
jgi:DNA repair exonuclease SbcCD ATPase subunit